MGGGSIQRARRKKKKKKKKKKKNQEKNNANIFIKPIFFDISVHILNEKNTTRSPSLQLSSQAVFYLLPMFVAIPNSSCAIKNCRLQNASVGILSIFGSYSFFF